MSERLSDKETRIVRAATGALWSLLRIHDDVDVSASFPVVEHRLNEQELDDALRDLMRRFLRDAKLDAAGGLDAGASQSLHRHGIEGRFARLSWSPSSVVPAFRESHFLGVCSAR